MVLLAAAACATPQPARAPLTTVSDIDLDRYLGKWYEIASLPNWFQRGCVDTTATYSRIDASTISVVNECRAGSQSGKLRRVEGTAWPAGDGGDPAKLKVQFFWPIRGDYWVIALDDRYRWAIVGHPQRNYLWILSREPVLESTLYRQLLRRAAEQGFDVSQVQRTAQSAR